MPHRVVLVLLGVFALGVGAIGVAGATDERPLAFTFGVRPEGVAAVVPPGATVCQAPIDVPESFDQVEIIVGTFHRPGPPLELRVTSPDRSGRGQLAAGYGDNLNHTIRTGHIAKEAQISVCVTNRGGHRLALYGNAGVAAPTSTLAFVDGRRLQTDLTLRFFDDGGSALARLPEMLRHAQAFKPTWVGAWTYWLLGVAVLLGGPVLALRALRAADG